MLQNQQYLILLWTFLYSIHMYSIHIYIYMCVCIDLFNICFCWPKRGDVRDVNINCKISTVSVFILIVKCRCSALPLGEFVIENPQWRPPVSVRPCCRAEGAVQSRSISPNSSCTSYCVSVNRGKQTVGNSGSLTEGQLIRKVGRLILFVCM